MKNLLRAVLAVWCIAVLGEYVFPNVFSNPGFMWSATVLLGVLIPAGVVHAIRHYSQTKDRSAVIALIVYAIVFSSYVMIPIVNIFVANFTVQNNQDPRLDLAPRIAVRMVTSESASVRKGCAQMLLLDYNTVATYRDSIGEYVEYVPSKMDKVRLHKMKEMRENAEREDAVLLAVSHRYIYVISVFVLLNLLVFSFGLWVAHKRDRG